MHMPSLLKNPLVALCALATLSGCAIRQTVVPVAAMPERQICIIENTSVRPGFIDAYKRTLGEKGYLPKQLPPSAAIIDCPVTSTYTANWRWDLALYMAYAEIKVYRNGRTVGEAKYDAQRGGGNLGKFIDAEQKIAELVQQLFPGGAGLTALQKEPPQP